MHKGKLVNILEASLIKGFPNTSSKSPDPFILLKNSLFPQPELVWITNSTKHLFKKFIPSVTFHISKLSYQ